MDTPAPQPANKLVPILVVLLIVASFFIGSLYTQVNLMKKGVGTDTGTVAGANQPLVEPTPQPVDIEVKDAQVLGSKDAKVALVEFTDYQCPFCGQLFTNTFPSIKKDYIDTGKIKYYVMDFPLTQIHPQAQLAAEASHCAGELGKFWEYHDVLFKNQTALTAEDLKKYAGTVGLNSSAFATCLDANKYKDTVNAWQAAGSKYGVRGTPASFIGKVDGGMVKQAIEVSGAQPYENFKTVIDAALAS